MPLLDEQLITDSATFVTANGAGTRGVSLRSLRKTARHRTGCCMSHQCHCRSRTRISSHARPWTMSRLLQSPSTPLSLVFFLVLFISIPVTFSNKPPPPPSSPSQGSHHIHSHPETYSFELPAKFDVHKELEGSLTSLNQLRMIEEKATPRNVTGQIGHAVYLHCLVEPLGDRMVSWIRLRDFHLLTVGMFTFSGDSRFVIRHGTLQANDWALQIKHVTPVDEGLYECQVNTDPPRSQYYYLHVVVPVAEMVGSPDMFVRAGAIINLTCVISRSPEPPAFVFWYHNDRMINYDYNNVGRGDISVQKNPEQVDSVISRLVIKGARHNDSGNYTCTPSNAEPTSIYVHVLQGEKRQSNRGTGSGGSIQNDGSSSTEYMASGAHQATLSPSSRQLLPWSHFLLFLGSLVLRELLLSPSTVSKVDSASVIGLT